MSEPDDLLEAELAALRPHDLSPGLRQRIARRLAGPPPSPSRRLLAAALVGGLAIACVAAVLLGRGGGRPVGPGRAQVRPQPPPREEAPLPTLQAYRLAFSRSPEELEALLDKHAVGDRRTDAAPLIHAFGRSDAESRAWIGEP